MSEFTANDFFMDFLNKTAIECKHNCYGTNLEVKNQEELIKNENTNGCLEKCFIVNYLAYLKYKQSE